MRKTKEYTIFVKGEVYGHFASDRYYHEFEEPFFKQYPELIDVINHFNHVDCLISDTI